MLPARPRPVARVPLERGRPRRHLRRRAAAVLRAGAVERQGPDPQGAHLRADRQRGQPRRGRQGVLVVPRRRPEPRVAARGGTTTLSGRSRTAADRREPQPRPGSSQSSSCSTRTPSTTTATGSSRSTTPRRTRTTCASGSASTTPGPTPRRCTSCRPCGTATPGRGIPAAAKPQLSSDGAGTIVAEHERFGPMALHAAPGPDGGHARGSCSARTRPTAQRLFGSRSSHAVSEGRDQRPRDPRGGDGQPRRSEGTKARVLVPGHGRSRARR